MLFSNIKKSERLEVQIHEMILEIREAETADDAFANSGFISGVAAMAASEHIITERRAKRIIKVASQNARVRAKRLRTEDFGKVLKEYKEKYKADGEFVSD